MITRITSQKQRRIFRIAAVFLLILYIGGTFPLDLFHSFVHHHEAVAHAHEQEKDPCHRLRYYPDTGQGCGHDSHLVVSDKCQMCDLVWHNDPTFLSAIDFALENYPNEFFSLLKQNLDSYRAVISSSRAPPALS